MIKGKITNQRNLWPIFSTEVLSETDVIKVLEARYLNRI